MTHVGIERLATGHHQEDRSERQECPQWMADKQVDRICRRHSPEHVGVLRNLAGTEGRQNPEPDDHHGAKNTGNASRPAMLDCEQRDQNQNRHWDDEA